MPSTNQFESNFQKQQNLLLKRKVESSTFQKSRIFYLKEKQNLLLRCHFSKINKIQDLQQKILLIKTSLFNVKTIWKKFVKLFTLVGVHYGLPLPTLITATGRFGLVWSNLHINLVTWVPPVTKTKKILQNFSSVLAMQIVTKKAKIKKSYAQERTFFKEINIVAR